MDKIKFMFDNEEAATKQMLRSLAYAGGRQFSKLEALHISTGNDQALEALCVIGDQINRNPTDTLGYRKLFLELCFYFGEETTC